MRATTTTMGVFMQPNQYKMAMPSIVQRTKHWARFGVPSTSTSTNTSSSSHTGNSLQLTQQFVDKMAIWNNNSQGAAHNQRTNRMTGFDGGVGARLHRPDLCNETTPYIPLIKPLTDKGYYHQLKWIVDPQTDAGNPRKDGMTTGGAVYLHDDKDYNMFKEFQSFLHQDVFGYVSQDAAVERCKRAREAYWKHVVSINPHTGKTLAEEANQQLKDKNETDYLLNLLNGGISEGSSSDSDSSSSSSENDSSGGIFPLELNSHYELIQVMHIPESTHYVVGTKVEHFDTADKKIVTFKQVVWSEYLQSLGEDSNGVCCRVTTQYVAASNKNYGAGAGHDVNKAKANLQLEYSGKGATHAKLPHTQKVYPQLPASWVVMIESGGMSSSGGEKPLLPDVHKPKLLSSHSS